MQAGYIFTHNTLIKTPQLKQTKKDIPEIKKKK